MKRFWTALAVALAAILAAAGCNDYGNTFQVPTGASISSLSPSNMPAGSAQFTLVVNGGGFVAKTVVQWNGATIPTTLQTDSAGNVLGISATVSAALVAKPGTAFVNTLSPHSGAGTNGLSNSLPFIINPPGNPVPTVSSISPTCAVAGSGAFTLSVMGSNFLPASDPSGGSQVQWTSALTQTQSTLPSVGTTTASQIQATVSIALLASADTARIAVFNPPAPQGSGGGGVSPVGQLFTVQQTAAPCAPPTPAISSNASAMEETPAVSADGRFVAYAAMQNDHAQVFVRDTCEGAAECQPRTTLLSVTTEGDAANDDSRSPSISADGRYVAFSSAATNLLPDAPQGRQVYLRDTCVGAASSSCTPSTQLISSDPNGALIGTESILPSVSASGRFVAFVAVTPSHAKSSVRARATAGSPNSGFRQVFVRDTCLAAENCTAKTTRISLQPGDTPASGAKPAGAALSSHAKHVALPGVTTATLFTRGVVVDDQVFLALTGQQ
jgi:WD40-like Beta Propeller Repeat